MTGQDRIINAESTDRLEYAKGALRTVIGAATKAGLHEIAAVAQAGLDLAENGAAACAAERGDHCEGVLAPAFRALSSTPTSPKPSVGERES